MFRLIRLPIIAVLAFFLGMLWEMEQANQRCEAAGGSPEGGICKGAQ